MTREEAIEWMQEEKASFERAPDLNGCPMTEYWQKDIDVYDMAISALRRQDHFREVTKKMEPLTNAQKIRSMSDEELAWELMLWRCEAVAKHHGIESEYPDTQKTILKWLQQPAEEDGHER